MNKAAVIQGNFVDLKFMHGYKCARISVDINIEEAEEFLRMFGTPDRVNPTPVVLARLAISTPTAEPMSGVSRAEPETDLNVMKSDFGAAPTELVKPRPPFRDLPRSQQAAIKCQDTHFQEWLFYTHPWSIGTTDEIGTNIALKKYLGIESKKELDVPGPAADAFDRLLTSYDHRNQVR